MSYESFATKSTYICTANSMSFTIQYSFHQRQPWDNPETTHDVPRVFVVHPILSGHQIMKEDWQTCLTYSQDHVQTERSIKLIWHTWVRTQPSGRERPPPPPVPQHGDMMCSDAQHSLQTWRDLEVLGSLVMFLSTQWRWWPLSLSASNT